jgi:hypothetical protein
MKLIHNHFLATLKNIKRLILIITTLSSAAFTAHAQKSNTWIYLSSTSNEVVYNLRPDIVKSMATLRKEIVKDKEVAKDKIEIKKELLEVEKEIPVKKEIKKNIVPKVTAPVVVTNTTVYDIQGNTAAAQYTSLQANFKFLFADAETGSLNSPAGVIELYKLEKGINTRSFCIPSGGCASVNIPIQIMEDGKIVVADAGTFRSAGANSGKSPLYLVVLPNGGYLQPGEYAFIDKSSLNRDASALYCFSFTVKQ